MSNYTKTTDFASKDSLSTGDAAKVVRGSEFETEFDAISTAIATKSDSAGPTFTGTLTFATISDGAISITAFVDEDNMASNSASLIPTQQSVKAYVDSQVATVDTLGEVLALSNTSSGTNLQMTTTDEIQFRDTALKIASSADGQLDIDADTELEVTAPTVDINASTAVLVSNDLKLDSDSAVLGFGADNDTTLTHTDGAGLTLNSTNKLMFNDASQFIQGSSATVLALGATDEIDLTATAIDVNGTMDVSGALTGTTATFTTGNNNAQLVLKSTDSDANVGPRLDLNRDKSVTPADGDLAGQIRFLAGNDLLDSGGNPDPEEITYGFIRMELDDVSDGSEDGNLDIQVILNGTARSRIKTNSTETVINDGSHDLDFRVESDGKTHMFFVDAGNNHVNIGTSTDRAGLLNIETNDNQSQLVLVSTDDDANTGPRMDFLRDSASPADDDIVSQIRFRGKNVRDDSSNTPETLAYAGFKVIAKDVSEGTEDGEFQINTQLNGTTVTSFTISPTEIAINDQSKDLDFRVESDGNTHGLFVDAGNNRVGILNSSPAFALDVTGDIATSGGLYVGGTTSSNLLDDYEQGSWTPVADFATTSPTAGATNGTGRYVKVGNLVTVWGHLKDIAVTGAVGDIRIQGLPFTSRLLANLERYVGVVRFTNINNSGFTNPVQIVPELQDNGTQIRLMVLRNNSTTDQINPASLNDGATRISITLSYETDA